VIASHLSARPLVLIDPELTIQDARRLWELARRLTLRQEALFEDALADENVIVPFNSHLIAMARNMQRLALPVIWR